MSTIQQIKNFIRHGKQARAADADDSTRAKQPSSPPQAQQQVGRGSPNSNQKNMAPSEPVLGAAAGAKKGEAPAAYSAAQIDGQNRAAGAAGVAAHIAEADQVNGRSRREENLAKLIAEENASKSKFTRYPGLERWELLEKMGDGAFSNVYRARDLQDKVGEVAIKVVRKFEMNSAQRSNILKEVQIMKQLDHPNIVKLIDFSESAQYYYIILELAPGGELFHQIVRLTYFSEDLSRHVITQVAKALEYLHEERGVVHRDIKPENILYNPMPFVPSKHPKLKQPGDEDKVDEGEFIPGVGAGGIGQIKIADFGLSKVVWDDQTMTPCGTVGYTAPEIVKDERYSKSVDMWALGCVLYTLLCGFPPFYDESIEVLTEKVARGQYTFLSPWWDDISKSAQDLISHLLCVDADKRYTIREFLAHPWVRAPGPTPRDEKKPTAFLRAFDASKIVDGDRRYDFRSPGAVNLREVFDVGYAVHRQEEEAKRRQQIGASKAGISRLAGLNESDEEEERDEDTEMGGDAGPAQQPGATQSLERSMRNAQIEDAQSVDAPRGRDRERQPHRQVDVHHHQKQGYGQHSAAVTEVARREVRKRQQQKGAFELSLDGATLLGRRGVKPTAPVA